MCLLLTQQSTSPALTNEWLTDFYSYNSDGLGVMRSEGGKLIVQKILPKSADELIAFYRENIQGYDCAWHLRMRTHGATDLINCHPYEILNQQEHGIDLWLMHNGILHTGNKADTSKSDTFHYIADYLRPMLAKNPDFAFSDAFSDLIGDHIGVSNKFVIMDNHNRMAVVNESEGVYWGGLWLSNEYAWTASKTSTKKPDYDTAWHYEQIAEKPEVKSWKTSHYSNDPVGQSFPYSYHDGEYYDRTSYDTQNYYKGYGASTTWSEDILDEVEILLEDLHEAGFKDVSMTPLDVVIEFLDRYSPEAFYDLAMMSLDGRLPEEDLLQCLYDYDFAEGYFPWLVNERAKVAIA
jgi:predicted glutamine amidotransferase